MRVWCKNQHKSAWMQTISIVITSKILENQQILSKALERKMADMQILTKLVKTARVETVLTHLKDLKQTPKTAQGLTILKEVQIAKVRQLTSLT